ncbi:aldehyde dehydrogenase family protein, partial [Citrobacter sp. VF227]
IVLKPSPETPLTALRLAELAREAGVPPGVFNVVTGGRVCGSALASHPSIAKISFTGSTVVGKKLAALAGEHMKRATMELGGHAPAIVFGDADVEKAVAVLAPSKFRNAGQVCVSPTRFLVHDSVFDRFVEGFTTFAKSVKVGDGLDPETKMGPLVH